MTVISTRNRLALTFAIAALSAIAAGIWWAGHTPPLAGSGAPGAGTQAPGSERAGAAPVGQVAPERTAAVPAADASDPEFSSIDEDGNPVAGAVRDGLVMRVQNAHGAPRADLRIVAHWRKGFGLYGKDIGRTDAAGRFPTTVAQVEHFEAVEVEDPKLGALEYRDDFLPTAEDPRTVCIVVPDLAPLRVRVVDGRGAPFAGAAVKTSGGGQGIVPRQHVLRGEDRDVSADASGHAEILVPQGVHEVSAEAAGGSLPQAVWAEVGAAGGDATVVLLRDEHRQDVLVRVTKAPGVTSGVRVVGFTRLAPRRTPAMAGRPGEPIYREFFVDRQSDAEFVVRAEPVPWRAVAYADGCEPGIADVPAGQTEVHVTLAPVAPPQPKARLVVTVLDPDGKPTYADIRVHETPDLVYGSDQSTTNDQLVIEREPQGRVCISASRYGFARCVAGPFELTAGEQRITLQLLRPQVVSGRVVDAAGNGVTARVRLHRPAGALRGLADGVPEILADAPTSDSLGGLVDGSFHFADCGPGEHEVWAFPQGGGLPARKRVMPGVPATVVLGEGLAGLAYVQVTVRDAVTRVPLPDVDVSCGGDLGRWGTITDEAGRCAFVAEPGELRIRARRAGYVVQHAPPRSVGEGPAAIEVLLSPSPLLFVRVLDGDGRPVAGAEVSVLGPGGEPIDLIDKEGHYDGWLQRTNQAGRADLRGAPAGALRLRIEHGGFTHELDVPAAMGRDGVFEARLP